MVRQNNMRSNIFFFDSVEVVAREGLHSNDKHSRRGHIPFDWLFRYIKQIIESFRFEDAHEYEYEI